MKLKAYFLLAALWIAPALAMEEHLPAETIVNHPKFLAAKQAFEEIGGVIEIQERNICIRLAFEPNISTHIPYDDLLWKRLERYVIHDRRRWLWRTLPNSLQGLCILRLAKKYSKKNSEFMAKVATLPEDIKEQILFLVNNNSD